MRRLNIVLAVVNSVFTVVSVIAMMNLLLAGESALLDLEALSQNPVNPKPCGMAAPDLSDVYYGLGLASRRWLWFWPYDVENFWGGAKETLCASESPNAAMRKLFSGVAEASVDITSASVSRTICKTGNGERMDVLSRVARAYIQSGPAFAFYWSRSDAPDKRCAWSESPFGFGASGACSNVETIRAHLKEAGEDRRVVQGSYGGLPEVEVMVYRLAALAVLSYHDYKHNKGACFKNSHGRNVSELCAEAYSGYGNVTRGDSSGGAFRPSLPPLRPPPPPTVPLNYNDSMSAFYDAKWHTTCADIISGAGVSTPQTVGTRHEHYEEEQRRTWPDPAQRYCVRTHELGMFDTEQLFGLPDPETVLDLSGGVPGFTDWMYNDWFLKPYFYDNRVLGSLSSPQKDLMIYSSARVATMMFWVVMGLCVTGWWLGFFAVPLMRQLLPMCVNVFRFLIRRGTFEPVPLYRPSISTVGLLATLTSVSLFAWVYFIDPYKTPVHQRVDCSNYGHDGNVWGTSEHTVRDRGIWAGVLNVVVALGAVIYSWLFRMIPPEGEYKSAITNVRTILLVVVCVVIQIVFDGLLLADDLKNWNARVQNFEDGVEMGRLAKTARNDGMVSLTTAVAGGACAATVAQLWSFESPYLSLGLRLVWLFLVVFLGFLASIVDATALADENRVTASMSPREDARVVRFVTAMIILAVAVYTWIRVQLETESVRKKVAEGMKSEWKTLAPTEKVKLNVVQNTEEQRPLTEKAKGGAPSSKETIEDDGLNEKIPQNTNNYMGINFFNRKTIRRAESRRSGSVLREGVQHWAGTPTASGQLPPLMTGGLCPR